MSPFQVPNGVPTERDAHLQSLFYLSFRVPSKGALPPGSVYMAPTERDAPLPGPLSTIKFRVRRAFLQGSKRGPMKKYAHFKSFPCLSFRVPSKGALPPSSLHRAPINRKRRSTSRVPFNHHSKSLVDEGPHEKEVPISRASFYASRFP